MADPIIYQAYAFDQVADLNNDGVKDDVFVLMTDSGDVHSVDITYRRDGAGAREVDAVIRDGGPVEVQTDDHYPIYAVRATSLGGRTSVTLSGHMDNDMQLDQVLLAQNGDGEWAANIMPSSGQIFEVTAANTLDGGQKSLWFQRDPDTDELIPIKQQTTFVYWPDDETSGEGQ